MKECELCSDPARMFCESDQASLCWDCDEKVHCANFLVAKHSRSLLCHVCQFPTPWKASGPKLGHTVSMCESCVSRCNGKHERDGDEESRGGNEEDHEDENDDGDDYEDEEDEDGDYSDGGGDEEEHEDVVEDEDGENQVVPWSSSPPPPVASSSSSEEECASRFGASGGSALKRIRESADLDSDDDIDCSSFQFNHTELSRALTSQASGNDEGTSFKSSRPLKDRKISEPIHSARVEDHSEAESRSMAIFTSLKRFQKSIISGDDMSSTILEIRKLSRDPRAVDLDTTNSAICNPTV